MRRNLSTRKRSFYIYFICAEESSRFHHRLVGMRDFVPPQWVPHLRPYSKPIYGRSAPLVSPACSSRSGAGGGFLVPISVASGLLQLVNLGLRNISLSHNLRNESLYAFKAPGLNRTQVKNGPKSALIRRWDADRESAAVQVEVRLSQGVNFLTAPLKKLRPSRE